MTVAGIIAEYNPFHNGHLLLARAVRRAGAEAVVAVMGGNWLQRGEPALFPKEVRVRAALAGGIDLVLELPAAYAAATAQRFARGGVGLLMGLGCVDILAFGSESGDLSLLGRCAGALADPRLDGEIRRRMESGIPYAAARQQGVRALFGEELSIPLSRPNDTLAVQYLREMDRLGGGLTPFTIPRQGAGHHSMAPRDDTPLPTASAAWLRETILSGGWREAAPYLPERCREVFSEAMARGRLASPDRLELPLLSALRRMDEAEFAALPDLSEGLERRLAAAVHDSGSLAGLLERAVTKRYPRARLRRILLAAYLGIPKEASAAPPPYLRVLGMNPRGARVLRLAKKRASLPLSHSLARLRELGGAAEQFALLESRAGDLYELLLPRPRGCGGEFSRKVIVAE